MKKNIKEKLKKLKLNLFNQNKKNFRTLDHN